VITNQISQNRRTMTKTEANIIYTIGHSTCSMADFIHILQDRGIRHVADIRRFPASRRHPQFNKEALAAALKSASIAYTHLEGLGGRRRAKADSPNTLWRNESFRGFADYMETAAFAEAAATLEELARRRPLVFMCAEALWWRCHRALISDYLKAGGWQVVHIATNGKESEHPYTQAARVADGRVFYFEPS